MSITFEHSLAWLWLILPITALLVGWLYFFRTKEEEWSKRLRYALAAARWTVITILCILLLLPNIIRLLEEEERPRLLLYTDASVSIPAAERAAVDAFVENAKTRLSEKYEVRHVPFGSEPMPENSERPLDSLYTDLGAVMTSANEDFYGENIGAVVVASDGIQNKGTDPRYVSLKGRANLYVLALGDTSVRADIELNQLLNNRFAFLNNDFEIKARIIASKLKGRQASVLFLKEGEEVARQSLDIGTGNFSKELQFLTKATEVGLNKYTVSIEVLEGEKNTINNTADAYIEVLDNRTKVKIIARAPHPDIAFIKRSVERNDQYEVSVDMIGDWDGRTTTADLFILHGLPTDANDMNLVKRIVVDGKPVFAFVTPEVSFRHFNNMDLGITLEVGRGKVDEVGGLLNTDFKLFNVNEENELKRYPPLYAPFGNYLLEADHQIALYQRVGTIATELPLMLFTVQDTRKTGMFFADGVWKWNLFESSIGEQGWTAQLIQKSVQYLAIKQKRTRLNVMAPQQLEEREQVVFNAEYYNESYELNNDPEVNLTVTDPEGNALDFRFRTTSNAYRASLGALQPGEYSWTAMVSVEGQQFSETGVFTVAENRSEYVNLVANHGLLDDLATRKGGSLFQLSASEGLIQELEALESAKPVIHTSKDWSSVIEWKWLLFTLILILSAEWFVRKYTGYV